MYNIEAVKYDMTTAIGFILLNIDVEEGIPATKLGPLLGMEPRSLSRTFKNLEEKGLIKRIVDSKDKRMVRIFLTEKGLEKREIARKTVKKFNSQIQNYIPKEEIETFFNVLNKVNEIIENNKILN
jgi:DNA-binding MarR family transcriptional regulator